MVALRRECEERVARVREACEAQLAAVQHQVSQLQGSGFRVQGSHLRSEGGGSRFVRFACLRACSVVRRTPVWGKRPHASAVCCLILKARMAVRQSREEVDRARRSPPRILLRVCYTMSGTDLGPLAARLVAAHEANVQSYQVPAHYAAAARCPVLT
eukprot:451729-Rhodomonas_salina.5